MTSRNEITGDTIATKPASDAYRENISKIDWSVKRTDPPADCNGSQHSKPASRMVFIGWITHAACEQLTEKSSAGQEIIHSDDISEYLPDCATPIYAEVLI